MDKSHFVSLSLDNDKIIIERAYTVCDYCGSKEIYSEEFPICKNCADQIKHLKFDH